MGERNFRCDGNLLLRWKFLLRSESLLATEIFFMRESEREKKGRGER